MAGWIRRHLLRHSHAANNVEGVTPAVRHASGRLFGHAVTESHARTVARSRQNVAVRPRKKHQTPKRPKKAHSAVKQLKEALHEFDDLAEEEDLVIEPGDFPIYCCGHTHWSGHVIFSKNTDMQIKIDEVYKTLLRKEGKKRIEREKRRGSSRHWMPPLTI